MLQSSPRKLSYCALQVRANDPERYLCTLVAPPEAREALFALYAFDVEIARVRHVVSQPIAGLIRLQWWRDALAGIEAGRPPAHPVVEALHHEAWPRLNAARARLENAVAAHERELEAEVPIAYLADLERHLEATGGEIARAALDLLGAGDERALEAGGRIGGAWALVRLLRALPQDARARRLLLPAALLERHGVALEAIFEGRGDARLAAVVAELAGWARGQLRLGRALRPHVPALARAALRPALFADLQLRRLRRAAYDPLAPALARPMPLAPLRLLWGHLRRAY